MKNQTKKWCVFALLLSSLLIVSCRKEIEPTKEIENYKVVDGRIVFNKFESFQNLMKEGVKLSPEEFAIRMSSLKGFIPYSSFKNNAPIASINPLISQIRSNSTGVRSNSIDPYDGLPMDSPTADDEYDDELVMDPYLRSVLNASREIQIEELIIRITETGVLFYEEWMGSRVNQLESAGTNFASYINDGAFTDYEFRSANVEEGIAVFLPPRYHSEGLMNMSDRGKKECVDCIKSNAVMPLISNCNQVRTFNWFGEKTTCTIGYAHRRRARGVVWAQNVIFYSSAGVDTRNQRRVMGAWWSSKADYMYLKIKGKLVVDIPAAGGPNILAFIDYNEITHPPFAEYNKNKVHHQIVPGAFGNFSIGIPIYSATIKFKNFKLAQKFKIKKHESSHEVRLGGMTAKMNIVFEE